MMNLRNLLSTLLALSTFVSATVLAVDGVVLIDQNKVLAGNVTPGDTPGFPLVLSHPGSYRLSGNLTVPSATNGIEIAADDITLDLNGFSIIGGGGGNARGIIGTGPRSRISISGGVISNFEGGINLVGSSHVLLENTRTNGAVGAALGQYSIMRRNVSSGLLQVSCPSAIVENVTSGNITGVIFPGTSCTSRNNRSLNLND